MKVLTFLTICVKIIMCEYDKRIITTLKYSKYHVVPTVINGEPAIRGQLPYLVSLKVPLYKLGRGRTVWENMCGGSIIGEQRVLTAAHCFEFNNFHYAKHPRILRVVAGNIKNNVVHSGDTETSEQSQWRNLRKVIIHRDFVFPVNDIALVFIDLPWNYTSYVNYGIPATRMTDYGKNCYSAGFGRVGKSMFADISPVLLYARINPLPRMECAVLWEMDMNSFICSDSALTDVGRGDSGGPLGCTDTADPAESVGRDLIVGVVSGKNYDKTTLFTRVAYYRDWIAKASGVKLNCNLFLVVITYLVLIYRYFVLLK